MIPKTGEQLTLFTKSAHTAPFEMKGKTEIKPIRSIRVNIEDERINIIFHALDSIKKRSLNSLKHPKLVLIVGDIKEHGLNYKILDELKETIEQLSTLSPTEERNAWAVYTTLRILDQMERYLRCYSIERFLIYFDEKLMDILKELYGKQASELYIKLDREIKLKEQIKEILESYEQGDKHKWRKKITMFLRSRKIKYPFLIFRLDYSRNHFRINHRFHKIVLDLSKANKKIVHPKLEALLRELEDSRNTVVLISNKEQIKITQKYLEAKGMDSKVVIDNGDKLEKIQQRTVITTPGEFKKFQSDFYPKDTLIYYDSDLYPRKEELEEGFDIILQLTV